MTHPVTIISFGYGHDVPPEAHLAVDVRHHFRDPHFDPELRNLTGVDAPVIDAVLDTPGIAMLIMLVTEAARTFLAGPSPGPVTIAVGCTGGRHRSVVIADETARRLRRTGVPAAVTHRDISRPVITRQNKEH